MNSLPSDSSAIVSPRHGHIIAAIWNPLDGKRTKLLDALHELSIILETGLGRESLSILLELTESVANPDALASLVIE
jgi:hypothetical protein